MKQFILVMGVLLILSACVANPAISSSEPVWTQTSPPPTETATAAWTDTPLPTFTLSPVPTSAWLLQGPGDVTIPILLFHHIGISPTNNRYYVPPEKFEQVIRVLRDYNYSTITTEMLVDAITYGEKLPPHPILITFDDGSLDNYTNAFPIMQKYGFTGAIYIVGKYLGTDGFMNREQVLEMYQAGWDIGSHSMNHYDLTKLNTEDQRREIIWSKKELEKTLGIKILTFAYPFGAKNESTISLVHEAGYIAAMGAEGYTDNQGKWNLFNLQRVEFKASEDEESFKRFLTWQGESK